MCVSVKKISKIEIKYLEFCIAKDMKIIERQRGGHWKIPLSYPKSNKIQKTDNIKHWLAWRGGGTAFHNK